MGTSIAKLPMKQAIGTSLVIISLNSIAGFLGYFGRVPVNLSLLFSFTLAASIGTIAGAYLVRFVRARQLQKVFGYFLLTVSVFVLWQNRVPDKPAPSSTVSGDRRVKSSATERFSASRRSLDR